MICRAAMQADIPWLIETSLNAYRLVFAPLLPECDWSGFDDACFMARFQRQWPDIRIAVRGATRLGFCLMTTCNIDMLFVADGQRGQGAGLFLLKDAETYGAATLECFALNSRARDFYKRHGWVETGHYARDFAGRSCDFVRYGRS
jgi:GNAT superfamily N-acetyltransferase